MPEVWWWALVALGAAMGAALMLWRPAMGLLREARLTTAKRRFHRQREWLEAKFIRLASANHRPDAPRWSDCDFDDSVYYVRNRATGELWAFVAVTVALDGLDVLSATSGGLVGNLRAGTAVFRFDSDHWETDGGAFLNHGPREAVRYYQNNLEVVDQELAHRP